MLLNFIFIVFVLTQLYRANALDLFISNKDIFFNDSILSSLNLICIYILLSFLYLPIAVLSIFSGYLFGFFWGGCVAYIGSILNILFAFVWARYLFKELFIKLRTKIKVLNSSFEKIEQNNRSYIFYARLFLLTPYNLLNIVCGVSDITFRGYLYTSLAGSILQAFIYSYMGSIIRKISSEAITAEGVIFSSLIVLFFIFIDISKRLIYKKRNLTE